MNWFEFGTLVFTLLLTVGGILCWHEAPEEPEVIGTAELTCTFTDGVAECITETQDGITVTVGKGGAG